MAAPTRPYFVKFQGEEILVEAISQEQAISKVVAPHVAGVRVAKAAEVMAHYRRVEPVTSVTEEPSPLLLLQSAGQAADALIDDGVRHPIGEDAQD